MGGPDSQMGYKIEFVKLPPLSHHLTIAVTPTNSTKFQALEELLGGLLEKHVIEEVVENSPGYYS